MKLTKSKLKEIIKEELIKEFTHPKEIINKVDSTLDDYKKSKQNYLTQLKTLKDEFNKANKSHLDDKFNKLRAKISSSSAIKEVAIVRLPTTKTVSSPASLKHMLVVTLKPGTMKIPEFLKLLHNVIGEGNGVFKSVVKGTGLKPYKPSEGETFVIGLMDSYIKSNQLSIEWPKGKIFNMTGEFI